MESDQQDVVVKNSFGLVTIASSESWEVTIEESLDKDHEWEVEIEGPKFYITFSVTSLEILRETASYLQKRLLGNGNPVLKSRKMEALAVGYFGESKVTLVWDDEDSNRCFFIIRGGAGHSAIRLTLLGDEARNLSNAFAKIVDQLPRDPVSAEVRQSTSKVQD